jgi:PDZ domain-containing protein
MTEADLESPPPPPIPPPPPTEPDGGPAGIGWPSRKHTVLATVLSVIGVLVFVAIVAGFLIHLPYVIISPGSATPLDDSVVMISGAPTFPQRAPVLFLTVRVTNEDPNVWRVVAAWLNSDDDVEKRQNVEGCLTPAESTLENALLMQQSQDDAKNVALTRLGYTVTADPPRTTVVEACPGTPAHGELVVGDQIVDIDGQPVTSSEQLFGEVRAHHPGDTVKVTVQRSGAPQDVSVVAGEIADKGLACKPVPAGSTASGAACLGVASQDFVSYHFPIDITINTQRVGGPSAGLAFTLAIIDNLTAGSLTGGKRVAVTGTINPDGSVGAVGGVEQKAITARTNGVQLMLVPMSELKDAKKGADSMKVVGVKSVDDALAALQAAGGAPVPPASAAAARS